MEPNSPLNVHDLAGSMVRARFPVGGPVAADWERLAVELNKLLVPAPDGPNVRKLIERWKRQSWAETQSATQAARYMTGELEHALAVDAAQRSREL
jgi:hypothetical protein